jgi:AraC family transcriptional activator of pobA
VSTPQAIPSFFLYGEAPRIVGDRFLHLEALDDRSRPSNWNIRPHSHANLSHLFYITDGGGRMQADDLVLHFTSPCLLLVPARRVHAFTFEAETQGTVLTIADGYQQEIMRRDPDLARLFSAPDCIEVANPDRFNRHFGELQRELAWKAPGHRAAVEGLLISMLVAALRLRHAATAGLPSELGAQASLVACFRSLVEEHFRTNLGIPGYADLLSATPKRLRAACLKIASQTPLAILQDRRLLEAKRLMLYSNMTLAEIGYYLGFSDPAYFSRFFRNLSGVSARTFRAEGEDWAATRDAA